MLQGRQHTPTAQAPPPKKTETTTQDGSLAKAPSIARLLNQLIQYAGLLGGNRLLPIQSGILGPSVEESDQTWKVGPVSALSETSRYGLARLEVIWPVSLIDRNRATLPLASHTGNAIDN